VTYYFWSPDSSYIALIVDPAAPEEHNRAHEAVAVINNMGEQFQLIIDGWLEHNDYDPWRPTSVD
jgi:hypothetical protein